MGKAPFWRQWQSMLFAAGYAGLTWPKQYGGQGLDERMRAIFTEECDRAGVPERLNIIGEDFAGPTIAHFGTGGQKARYLRPILTGEEIWCQLFSEPDSGSDLASLRTRAVRVKGDGEVGGGWRIPARRSGPAARSSRPTPSSSPARAAASGSGGSPTSCSRWTATA